MGSLLCVGRRSGGEKQSEVMGLRDLEFESRPPPTEVKGLRDLELESRPPPSIIQVIKRDCRDRRNFWEDPDFEATEMSLFPSGNRPDSLLGQLIEWKRPTDLCRGRDLEMFVDGFSRFDVNQGKLGNCWFLAAVACLCSTKNKHKFHRIVPKDNQFGKDYAGIFYFRFWQFGEWVDVVIDDRLPTIDGKLVFVHSSTKNEFWPPLLEKAYAKLNGSYEALVGGLTSEAMEDFTGGVTQTFDLGKDKPKDLFVIMKKAFERDSLMCGSIYKKAGDENGIRENGLYGGHAYSITSAKKITVRGLQFKLVRVRNPHGDAGEWNGAWSDKSSEWDMFTEDEKKNLDLKLEADGEFWMAFDDFVNNFSLLEICMMVPDHETSETGNKRRWERVKHEGSWKRNVNAGGCRSYNDNLDNFVNFATNPQYRVDVVDPDEDDDDNTGTLIIALMQKDRRLLKLEMAIGYALYMLPLYIRRVGPVDVEFFRDNSPVAETFQGTRETVGRHKLPPGPYLIVPSTSSPGEESDFLLRIFSENKALSFYLGL